MHAGEGGGGPGGLSIGGLTHLWSSESTSLISTKARNNVLGGSASPRTWSQNSATSCNQTCILKAGLTTALPVAVKITAAFHFFASRSFQSAAGDIANISQFIIHRCIREVTEALYSRRSDYVFFSRSREKQDGPACDFAKTAGFHMMQGIIDCTHMALQVPHNNPVMLHNRKGYHSLNVQLLCIHTQRFLMINANYPGSSHDAFILRQSGVSEILQPPHQTRGRLLGDKDYLLANWLMTILHSPTTCALQSYNESHAATRNIIE
uniref:putative nuclease HARBI1 n=1 Tax=Pristiophorus japonicus TaxID=55135 RepID=UPI00398F6995